MQEKISPRGNFFHRRVGSDMGAAAVRAAPRRRRRSSSEASEARAVSQESLIKSASDAFRAALDREAASAYTALSAATDNAGAKKSPPSCHNC
jgi:hypothetical protein